MRGAQVEALALLREQAQGPAVDCVIEESSLKRAIRVLLAGLLAGATGLWLWRAGRWGWKPWRNCSSATWRRVTPGIS